MTTSDANDLATEVHQTVRAYVQMYAWRLAGTPFVVQQVYRDLHAGPAGSEAVVKGAVPGPTTS